VAENGRGAVWGLDFHGPRPMIDGLYPNLLAVRDPIFPADSSCSGRRE
jgi:hypothetical protein